MVGYQAADVGQLQRRHRAVHPQQLLDEQLAYLQGVAQAIHPRYCKIYKPIYTKEIIPEWTEGSEYGHECFWKLH